MIPIYGSLSFSLVSVYDHNENQTYTLRFINASPGIVLVHLVTALTLNTACGWYTISTTFSVSNV